MAKRLELRELKEFQYREDALQNLALAHWLQSARICRKNGLCKRCTTLTGTFDFLKRLRIPIRGLHSMPSTNACMEAFLSRDATKGQKYLLIA